MELKETNQAFQIKLLREVTEFWVVQGKKQQREDMVKEDILYLMNYNKENDVALFPEMNFVIWMSWPCWVVIFSSPYAFHVGKWHCLWTILERNINIFPNQESFPDMLFKYNG